MQHESTSLWHDTASPASHAPLAGDDGADVVVVGAGITGLTTALLLRQQGMDVVVVEALRVAGGVTGRTTAKVTSQHALLYGEIASKHGEATASVYATANQAAVEKVAALVAQGGIECEFERRSAYTYTQDPSRLRDIDGEVELCQRLGLPATFTQDTELPFDVLGAIRFDDQAQFQPVAYCDGLARMLVDAGGRLYEGTRVTGVDDGEPVTVRTENGTITAGAVVLASHVPLLDRGLFFAKVEPMASHAIAAEVGEVTPAGMYISADSPSRSVRSFAQNGRRWLVVVGEGHRVGEASDERVNQQNLADFAGQHWPSSRVTHRWMAEDYTPQDSVPYIGALARTAGAIYVATGYQKWGLTNGTVAAMILNDVVAGRDHPWAGVFDANRLTPTASAKSFVEHNVKAGVHLVKDRLTSTPEIEAIPPGGGAVVRAGGKHIAVTKGEDGSATAVSATCTHMGCLVAYNNADRTWDCPCHGSRFGADGAVLHGPAVKPLEAAELPAAEG